MAAWMLHGGCVGEEAGDSDLSADFLNFGAGDFPFKIPLKNKSASKLCFFLALAPRSGCGAAISHAVARTSFVFCNSRSRYRIVMAASRLLGAAASCAILWSFATRHRKSFFTGCIKAAIVICQQIFSILVLVILLSKFRLKSASKSCFFPTAECFGVSAHIAFGVIRGTARPCRLVSPVPGTRVPGTQGSGNQGSGQGSGNPRFREPEGSGNPRFREPGFEQGSGNNGFWLASGFRDVKVPGSQGSRTRFREP